MNAPASAAALDNVHRMQRRLRVTGIVQGVGFRPYVWHLAKALNLAGWVRNDAAGVEILVEGEPEQIETFTCRLPKEIPPLAQVRDLTWCDNPATGEYVDFTITESGAGRAATLIGPDTATCPDCLAELFDPADRRWRYAFINCTHCGPRYTLTRGLPYDRAQTSMAVFPLCPDCEREYRDPADRRFHAEPTACPVCGPGLWLVELPGIPPSHLYPRTGAFPKGGENPPPIAEGFLPLEKGGQEGFNSGGKNPIDPIAETLRYLQAGQILAIKGLGGFHLACDARNAAAVQTLRARKNREEKPFAVMAANLASLAEWVEISPAEAELLRSPERPIVLLRKKPGADAVFPDIAPGLAWLGVMLPYTPLHWLIFHEAAGRPAGTEWMGQPQELVLVMTSANPGGEPLVIGNDEAVERLAGIADAVLMHDRDIVVRCDDSVVRCVEGIPPSHLYPRKGAFPKGGEHQHASEKGSPPLKKGGQGGFDGTANITPQFIRRARGYTPRAIRLPRSGPPVLALGGYLKNTLCVTRGDEAFLSQHIGGLDNPATCGMLMEVTDHLLDILQVRPEAVAHDLHPDFFSSRHALELAGQWNVPAVAVQHHHAHIAAVAAEHGATGPLLGLALDGVGLGSDGGAWGGRTAAGGGREFLPPGPSLAPAAARRRQGGQGALAHGRCRLVQTGTYRRDFPPLSRPAPGPATACDAGARRPLPAHH
jgi:hydrogenase maturation protein HypF